MVRIVIFAKFPTPGEVKTRLTPRVSPEDAADIHLASLRAVIEIARKVDVATVILAATPDGRLDDFEELLAFEGLRVISQGQGTLGDRLQAVAETMFAENTAPVLFLGADSPTLPHDRIQEAIVALGESDIVMGPSDDGGYYLLGIAPNGLIEQAADSGSPKDTLRLACTSRPASQRGEPISAALFRGIDWGTERVAGQTRDAARSSGLTLKEIEAWYDLDHWRDLKRVRDDLAARDLTDAAATRKLLQVIRNILNKDGEA
ncbi:MAG: TIGR04282 family arsenosugar biosynthesis glycosyltransferase [Planctomycetota bacterium]|jgi:rSAM/selenodomain-associated transferase 1